MKIAVFGASGMIGQRIVNEALTRGHQVTAVGRDPAKIAASKAKAVKGDSTDAAAIAAIVGGHDAVVNATKAASADGHEFPDTANAMVTGMGKAGAKRILYVGGAGCLEIAPGQRLFDLPGFPPTVRPHSQKHFEALQIFKKSNLDWSFLSPRQVIKPGERKGTYRAGGTTLLKDSEGKSEISAEDFAIAVVDELEKGAHLKQHFTVAY